jgi:small subunit ribosomal protein S18
MRGSKFGQWAILFERISGVFDMPRPGSARERREKKEQFQNFNRPKLKIARITAEGENYNDNKDTESLRKMMSGNGKILSRKRTGANAMEQRMVAQAVKRARYMALLPYVTAAM